MIVLDAGVLIAHLSVTDVHQEAAFRILDTEKDLLIHPLTLAESLAYPARVRASTSLTLPDCCVMAAAVHNDATIATFDRRLADAARTRGVSVVGA